MEPVTSSQLQSLPLEPQSISPPSTSPPLPFESVGALTVSVFVPCATEGLKFAVTSWSIPSKETVHLFPAGVGQSAQLPNVQIPWLAAVRITVPVGADVEK